LLHHANLGAQRQILGVQLHGAPCGPT